MFPYNDPIRADLVFHHSVGSTIVQRYLHQILEAALHVQTQYVAMDILSFTVKQGLAHPIQVRFLCYYRFL
jgi:hypothetical protein